MTKYYDIYTKQKKRRKKGRKNNESQWLNHYSFEWKPSSAFLYITPTEFLRMGLREQRVARGKGRPCDNKHEDS